MRNNLTSRERIIPSLRDESVFYEIPGTPYLATIVLSLRDAIFSRTRSRHCVPSYYRAVPAGRAAGPLQHQILRNTQLLPGREPIGHCIPQVTPAALGSSRPNRECEVLYLSAQFVEL
jgi:hypothetical protein